MRKENPWTAPTAAPPTACQARPLIEERCKAKKCTLTPIIVDFCHWEDLDFAKYNALPEKGKSITHPEWTNENEAWAKVVKGIKRVCEAWSG